MDSPYFIDSFRKNNREHVFVHLLGNGGIYHADIRSYRLNHDADWKATDNGLVLTIEQLPNLIAALQKAISIAMTGSNEICDD